MPARSLRATDRPSRQDRYVVGTECPGEYDWLLWVPLSAVDPFFTTRAEPRGNSIVVHVVGDIDMATADRLCSDVAPLVDSGRDLILDLADVVFMDSAGINALRATRRTLVEHGSSFTVRNPSSSVRLALDVTGLAALLIESANNAPS